MTRLPWNDSGLSLGPGRPFCGRLSVRQADYGGEGRVFDMRRRDFISLLGGLAASWPRATYAEQPAKQMVGFLRGAGNNRIGAADFAQRPLSLHA
jgi:hypothetical protein